MAVSAEAIREVIASESGLDESELTPEATLKDLDIGSLDMASVAFELEDRFGFELDPENISPDFTIAEFTAYVQSLKRP